MPGGQREVFDTGLRTEIRASSALAFRETCCWCTRVDNSGQRAGRRQPGGCLRSRDRRPVGTLDRLAFEAFGLASRYVPNREDTSTAIGVRDLPARLGRATRVARARDPLPRRRLHRARGRSDVSVTSPRRHLVPIAPRLRRSRADAPVSAGCNPGSKPRPAGTASRTTTSARFMSSPWRGSRCDDSIAPLHLAPVHLCTVLEHFPPFQIRLDVLALAPDRPHLLARRQWRLVLDVLRTRLRPVAVSRSASPRCGVENSITA